MAQIGVEMPGYAFMGKAHSNAYKKIAYITYPPPLEPLLVGIAGRNEQGVSEAALRYGWDYATTDWRDLIADERIGLFDNGGPNSLHAEPTIAAALAGKHVVCEKPARARRERELRHLEAGRGDGREAPVRVQLPLRSGGAPRARDDRGGRRRDTPLPRPRLQDWGDDVSLDTWRFHPDEAVSGALGDLMTHVVDLARFLNGEIDTVSGFATCSCPAARSTTRWRPRSSSQTARSARSVGDTLCARAPQRVPVGGQRHEGIAGVRHGTAERAPGLSR